MTDVGKTFYVTSTSSVPGAIQVIEGHKHPPSHLPTAFWGTSRLAALEFQETYLDIELKRIKSKLEQLLANKAKLDLLLKEEREKTIPSSV